MNDVNPHELRVGKGDPDSLDVERVGQFEVSPAKPVRWVGRLVDDGGMLGRQGEHRLGHTVESPLVHGEGPHEGSVVGRAALDDHELVSDHRVVRWVEDHVDLGAVEPTEIADRLAGLIGMDGPPELPIDVVDGRAYEVVGHKEVEVPHVAGLHPSGVPLKYGNQSSSRPGGPGRSRRHGGGLQWFAP